MFCPNCGKSNPDKKTFCRQCGVVLPDLDSKTGGKPLTLTKRFELLSIHFILSTVVSFGFGIFLLYLFFSGRVNEVGVIAALMFFIIGIWQIIGIININQLKKLFERKKDAEVKISDNKERVLNSKNTNELLPKADFENIVPTSVTENTTKDLYEKIKRSSKP